MSFFGKLFGEEEAITSLSQQESFVGILYAIIAAEGQITQEEGQEFMKMVSRAKIMATVTGNQWKDMITKLTKLLKKGGAEAVANLAVKNIPEEMRAGVFAYACELVFADGYADKAEQNLLDKLAAAP